MSPGKGGRNRIAMATKVTFVDHRREVVDDYSATWEGTLIPVTRK